MTVFNRVLIIVSLGVTSAITAYFGHTFAADAFMKPTEIRILGEPVTGRLVRDAFGNPVGFEAFSEEPPSGAAVLALNGE